MQPDPVKMAPCIGTIDAIVFDDQPGSMLSKVVHQVLPGAGLVVTIDVGPHLKKIALLVQQAGDVDAYGTQTMAVERLLQQVSQLSLRLAFAGGMPEVLFELLQCGLRLFGMLLPMLLLAELLHIAQTLPLPLGVLAGLTLYLMQMLQHAEQQDQHNHGSKQPQARVGLPLLLNLAPLAM